MRLYLDKQGNYHYEDSVGGAAVVEMSRIIETRVKTLDRVFRLNVDGLCVSGYTLRDPHGRLAYEWDVVGTTNEPDKIEECLPITRDWPNELVYRRVVATPQRPRQSWWRRIMRIA